VTPPEEPVEPAPEEPGSGTEEPPVEEPVDLLADPPSESVDETAAEHTTATSSEPSPTGSLVETVG
jgi:hypothetical protein